MQAQARRSPVTPMATVGDYGISGQVLTSNGPNTPPSFQGAFGVTDMDSDDTNVSTTLRNLTDLSQDLLAGNTYVGRLVLIANNSTGPEGLQFDCNGGTATFTRFRMTAEEAPIGATLGTTNSTAVGTPLNNTVVSTGDTAYCFVISLEINAAGTFIPRYAENSAHVTGVATIRRGSFLDLKVGP